VLPSVAAWRPRDPLTARVLEPVVRGVSARGYAGSPEPGPVGARSRGTSKSTVSRTVRGRLTAALERPLSRRLDTLEVLARFLDVLDGVGVGGPTVIVALGLTRDGENVPLGLRLGSTENAAVCTERLQDLVGRGLPMADRVLGVLDGGRGCAGRCRMCSAPRP